MPGRRLSPKAAHGYLNDMDAAVKALRVNIDEIIRRGEHPASDGFPNGAGGGGGTGVSDPTSVTAMAKPMLDPIGGAIERLMMLVAEMGKRAQVASSLQVVIMEVATEDRGRVSTVRACDACEDPIAGRTYAGFCGSCHQAWLRWCGKLSDSADRKEYRNRFIEERRVSLAEKNRIHVHA